MKFWIDKTSDSENVVIADPKSLLIGSIDKEHADSIAQQLKDGTTPAEALGSEGLMVIPLTQLQSVVSRSTDTTVDIKFKANKEIKSVDIDFEDENISQEFVDYINPYMPDTLAKTVYRQSALVAAAPSILAILLFFVVAYAYWNKFRLPIYIVGAVWMLFAGCMLYKRLTSPPEITRWLIKGKAVRKALGEIKTAVSMAFVVAVACAISLQFPDSYGEKALYDRVYHEMIVPDSVPKLLANGADMYYEDEDGDTALSLAIMWGETDVAIAMIDAGYDLNRPVSTGQAILETAVYEEDYQVVDAILVKNGLNMPDNSEFDIVETAKEYAIDYEDDRLLELLKKHKNIVQSDLQLDQ